MGELARWADNNFTLRCYNCSWWQSPSFPWFTEEGGRGYSQWRGLSGGEFVGRWCCKFCVRSRNSELVQSVESDEQDLRPCAVVEHSRCDEESESSCLAHPPTV